MTARDLHNLNFRRNLCRQIITELDCMTPDDLIALEATEEQRQDSLVEYKRQLAEIDAQIAALTGTPPPVMVGLKTAVLFGTEGS